MSSNVYLNSQNKYGPTTMFGYTLTADQPINVGAGAQTVLFNTALAGGSASPYFNVSAGGEFTVLISGMYSIQPMFMVRLANIAHPLAYQAAVVIERASAPGTFIATGIVSDRCKEGIIVDRGFGTQFTGYFSAGDKITIGYENKSVTPGHNVNIKAGESVLWLTKLR